MGALLALGDPLYSHGVHWAELLVVLVKVVVAFGALLVSVMLMIWFERKVISDMQARVGPNRAGPWGLLQTLADGIKLFFKGTSSPNGPIGPCSSWPRTFRSCPHSSPSPSCPWAGW